MAKAETDYNSEMIDVCIDEILDVVDKLKTAVEQIECTNVPQTAARDKMIEIIERALLPYLSEFVQCTEVFEQGVEE